MSAQHSAGLPEIVGRFADEQQGLIIFSGNDAATVSSSAFALARHVWERTGRATTVITSGQDATELHDLPFTFRTAAGRSDQREQVWTAVAEGAGVILVDCLPDAETLIRVVEAALGGALVISTLSLSDSAYVRVLDLLQSAEDWDIRPRFDTALYAVVQIQAGGSIRDGDVFIPG